MGGGAGKHWAFVAERVVEGFLLAQLSYWYDQYHGYGRLNPLGTETQPKPLVYLQVALFPNAWVQQRKTRVQFCKPHPRILVTNYLELVWTKKLAVLNGLRPKKIGLLCAHMKKKNEKKKEQTARNEEPATQCALQAEPSTRTIGPMPEKNIGQFSPCWLFLWLSSTVCAGGRQEKIERFWFPEKKHFFRRFSVGQRESPALHFR